MTLFEMSDALVDDIARLRPISATFMGIPGHDHTWDDLSPAGMAAQAQVWEAWRARLHAYDPGEDRWQKLAHYVMIDWLMVELESLHHCDYEVDLNSIASPLQMFRMVFDSMDTSTEKSWENVALRLEGLPNALEGYRKGLEKGLQAGRTVAHRQVRAGISEAQIYAGDASFFRGLATKYGEGPLQSRLHAGARMASAAYGAMATWLEVDYLPHARVKEGVGEAEYQRAARRWVGSPIDLKEAYAWGWSELRRLLGLMQGLAEKIQPGAELSEVLTRLQTDPVAADPEAFRAYLEARQHQALAALEGSHFDVPEAIRRIDVKLAPPTGRPGAYYCSPSEDFSRPGAVWYSVVGEGPFALFDEVSTAYHEGFPGHHLQIGIQVSLTQQLCRLHRVAYGYSGFAEGWALYAEQLMGELGYYERPEFELGMLANQMMRAVRVVFDIGAHLELPLPADAVFHPGEAWTFELGVELLQKFGGADPVTAQSEISRYLGWPAQAISYKIGQRVILALREEFRQRFGDNNREFHRRVLGCGNVNLEMLREMVLAVVSRQPACRG